MIPQNIKTILDMPFYENSVTLWLIAAGVGLAAFLFLVLLKMIAGRRFKKLAQKTANHLDDFAVELLASTHALLLLVIGLYAASLVLALPEDLSKILSKLLLFAFLLQAGIWGSALINFVLQQYLETRKTEDERYTTLTMLGPMHFLGLMIVWSLVLLVALDNLGVDITALVAGLGIGGVALALAVQNILGDLFASLSIVIDRPFKIGDFIIVEDLLGTVEHIGLKTTRLRSLGGEQLIFSNSDLLKSRIRNYKRMYERRVVFGFGVIYQTTYEQLTSVPGTVKEIIASQDSTRFDRAHFFKYGDSSLDFEVVYYVTSPDYNVYMDIQQAINLALFKAFHEAGIEFAYPTRTLYIEKSGE